MSKKILKDEEYEPKYDYDFDEDYFDDNFGNDRDYGLYSYSYKPNYTMLGRNANNERFGIELEIDKGKNGIKCCEELKALSRYIYLKHDGSLVNGIEIVSMPATLATHKSEKVIPWKKIMKTALKYGFRSHNAGTCGLHIHVSRNFFGDSYEEQQLNIAKLILLVNRFWNKYIVPFSRRDMYELERWANNIELLNSREKEIISKDLVNSISSHKMVIDKLSSQETGIHDDRYCAVNIQNKNTVEFRIFRGTLRYRTFIASLEFVSEMIHYAKTTPLNKIQNTEWLDIFGNTEYTELRAYLEEKGLFYNS